MSNRRIYVHVGCPKTGTTFLQSTFWRSLPQLAGLGVALPLTGPDHHHLAEALCDVGPDRDPDGAGDVITRMSRAIEQSTSPTLLISSEEFVGLDRRQAARLHGLLRTSAPDAEVHVVLTVRDLVRQAQSDWQQQIQNRSTVSWSSFSDSLVSGSRLAAYFLPSQDSASIAQVWQGELPAYRIHVVTVPQAGSSKDVLLQRFCAVLGVSRAALDVEVGEPNRSLGAVEAEVLRRVNVALGDRLPRLGTGYGRVGKRHLAHRVLAPMSNGARPEVDTRLAAWCDTHTDRMISELREGGFDVIGDLEDLRSETAPSADGSPSWDEATIAEAAVKALADMLDQRHRDLRRLRSLRRKHGRGDSAGVAAPIGHS